MSEFFSLKDQVAVITGGTSGIGLKAAERFIAAGANVVISGRKDGTEIQRLGASYFIARGERGLRIFAVALHPPSPAG